MRACELLFLALGVAAVAASADAGDLALGRHLYRHRCAVCHGNDGRGDGPAGGYQRPRPRNLVEDAYKFRSTQVGEAPRAEDVARTLRHGLPGTSMPAWSGLSNDEVEALTAFLFELSERYEPGDYDEGTVVLPSRPMSGDPARGSEVYQRLKCWECHGREGRGDGTANKTLVDEKGHRTTAADLRRPSRFKGGHLFEDVYRVFLTGIDGTPMPSYKGTLSDEDARDLVAFVLSLNIEE